MRYQFCLAVSLICVSSALFGCGEGRPPAPGEDAFDAANDIIRSDDAGVSHGNTEQAEAMAAEFSQMLDAADEALFSGGSEGGIDRTGGKFLTYCRVSGNKVAFLVHVPQFKQYKDDVRDALISVAWMTANQVVSDSGLTDVEKIGIGLRGTLIYGGLAIGPPGEDPEMTENSFSVDDELLYEFFAEAAPAGEPETDESESDEAEGDEPQETE
jgi:hypothetical protein